MSRKLSAFSMLSLVVLAACNDGGDDGGTPIAPEIVISHVPNGVLSAFFVSDWTPFEAAATALRTMNPLYTVQQFSWWQNSTPPVYDSYSIANARVEYAHAAGLTGAGQIISIVDAGFLQSHDEFAGKTIYLPGGGNNPGVDDHGTSVASVAAGIATGGQMIGVAPGAALALGSFNGDASLTAANNQAASLGAIVQNNSWGRVDSGGNELAATAAEFQNAFSGASGTTYYNSILNLAQNTVVVFAASNDVTRTTVDLMGGLPLLDPVLQNSWITVINVVPTFSGSSITSGAIVSSACLEAAAWCMAADGSVYAALSTGNSNYDLAFGTSFAAPQVSGAIALLAEAFPALNAEELRARLLASADNGFYTHTGYVEFSPTVSHGFDPQFGHGFLNMQAALSPIGGSYLPRSSGGAVAVNSPTVLSSGMVGATLSTRLAQYDLVVVDGLGSGFDLPASVLAASATPVYDPFGSIYDLLASDLGSGLVDPFSPGSAFSASAKGRELAFETGDLRLAMLVPDDGASDIGLSVSRQFDFDRSQLRLGLSIMRETDGFVGVSSLLPGEAISGNHGAVTVDWGVALANDAQIALSGSVGIAQPDGYLSDMDMSAVGYNSVSLSYSLKNTWAKGDRVSFGIGLPQAIGSGQARATLPVAYANGAASFSTVDIALAPEARQVDLSVGYGVPLARGADILFRAVRSLNDGNIAGRAGAEATVALRMQF